MFTSETFYIDFLSYEITKEQTLTPYNDSFEELGFDSMSMMYNFGDLGII
jgi:hypothetical protein